MSEQQQQQQYEAEEQSTGKKLICLFGLSADPPTGYGGHVGIAQTLQQQERWDEVWVMPVYRHTFQVCI
jgi:nicotinic acid mononucleotide adenylyltransferase